MGKLNQGCVQREQVILGRDGTIQRFVEGYEDCAFTAPLVRMTPARRLYQQLTHSACRNSLEVQRRFERDTAGLRKFEEGLVD